MRKKFRNRNNEHNAVICSQIKLIDRLLVQSISSDYREWWKHRITNIKPDNNLFKNIKKISKYKSQNAMPHTLFNSDSTESYTSCKEKCDAFAHQFAKAHQLTKSNISCIENEVKIISALYENGEPIVAFSRTLPADFKETENHQNINEPTRKKFINSSELRQIIKSRNNKKSSGNDCMPNYALKKLSATTIYWLVVLFNHITNIQHIPENWKFARITNLPESPIPKQNKNINTVENWRSISQLPTLSKCYEKVLDNQLREFCTASNLLDPYQFGFQPGCSTVHAIAKIVNDISKGLNMNKPTLAVLIDLQAAFDVLWHDGLVYKLHKFKFEPHIIRLIKNFLRNRKFAVTINNSISNIKNIVAGTPQGSIISAILFILYLNDLPKPKKGFCEIFRILFADDIIIYTITKNINFANMAMNKYLNEIHEFITKWKLKINVSKCESISIVGHYKDLDKKIRKEALNVKFKINQNLVTQAKNVKYLGIVLSQNFQFIEHVNHILRKVNAAQSLLSNIFNNKYLGKHIKLIAYKQLIRPLIMYASPCWLLKNLISSYQVEKIRKKERYFLRKCCNIFRKENSVEYINSKILYDDARVNRIDKEIIKQNIKFLEKAQNHDKPIVRDIFDNNRESNEKKYKSISYFLDLRNDNMLNENDLLLIFNKKKHNETENVYIQAQNEIEY